MVLEWRGRLKSAGAGHGIMSSVLALLFGVLAPSCATTRIHADRPALVAYAIFVNAHGFSIPVDASERHVTPEGRRDERAPYSVETHVHTIADSLRSSPTHRVLLFIHGGLNGISGAARRNSAVLDSLRANGYFPIFLNWDGAFAVSYADHLFHPSQPSGAAHGLYGLLYPPLTLVGDVLRGIVRFPLDALKQVDHEGDISLPWYKGFYYPEFIGTGAISFEGADSLDSYVGVAYERSKRLAAVREALGLPMIPVRLLPVPLLDAIGTSSWDNLRRRTRVMLRPDEAMLRSEADVASHGPSGAAGVLMDTLAAMAQADSTVRLVLVGHSMGTMVASTILAEYPDLTVDDVVFLAAASTVEDYVASVVPFLERHPETQFYNLTLHPLAELRERHMLLARGSLLVWIDDFLASPSVMSDRTMGRYDNLGAASRRTPGLVRRQVHFRVFDYYNRDQQGYGPRGTQPSRHGDFTRMPFWAESFWKPGPTDSTAAWRGLARPRHPKFPSPPASASARVEGGGRRQGAHGIGVTSESEWSRSKDSETQTREPPF